MNRKYDDVTKVEEALTRYVECHEDEMPKEKLIEYYRSMVERCEEEGLADRASYLRERLKSLEDNTDCV